MGADVAQREAGAPRTRTNRREDILLLIDHFIDRFNRLQEKNIAAVSDDALALIETALDNSKHDAEILLYSALISHELGDEEVTLQTLEEMIERDDSFRIYVADDPDFRSLRGNERFDRLIVP